jgi:hypothetical protein
MPEQSNEQIPSNRLCTMPNSGATNYSAPLRAGELVNHKRLIFYVDVPAIPFASLPNAATVAFSLVEGNDSTFASQVISTTALGTVTGAASAGAPSATFGCRAVLAGGSILD